jgi:hypothetical protein
MLAVGGATVQDVVRSRAGRVVGRGARPAWGERCISEVYMVVIDVLRARAPPIAPVSRRGRTRAVAVVDDDVAARAAFSFAVRDGRGGAARGGDELDAWR